MNQSEYSDLGVRLEVDGRGVQVRLLTTPELEFGGNTTEPFVPPCHPGAIEELLNEVSQAIRNCRPADGELPARNLTALARAHTEVRELGSVGERLFYALFPGTIGQQLRRWLPGGLQQGRKLRVRLLLDPAEPRLACLASLPWELLFDRQRGRFLCRDLQTLLVRQLDVPVTTPRKIRGQLRVVVLMSDPVRGAPSLDLQRECKRIESRWGELAPVSVEVIPRATLGRLRARLDREPCHVLHFMGHGCFDEESGQGALLFETEESGTALVTAGRLADCLQIGGDLRLVFLNSCVSGRWPRRRGLDPYASVAMALVRVGVPNVVAMQQPISDEAAIIFSDAFYSALARGDTIEEAVCEGRLAMLELPHSAEWPIPVHYMGGADGRVLPRQPGGRAPKEVRRHILDRSVLIRQRTAHFVGRKFVFDRLDTFFRSQGSGYFLLIGEPGIGKTALVAELVRRHQYLHHFNIGAERTDRFLRNLCAQLIVRHDLGYASLPPEAGRDADLLVELLAESTSRLPAGEPLILLVDALDEVDGKALLRGGNLLALPQLLPERVLVVLTMRSDLDDRAPLRIDLRETFEIEAQSPENVGDVREYLRTLLGRAGIRRYLARNKLAEEQFVTRLAQRSAGNFMYLFHVTREIEGEGGAYHDLEIDRLPAGLVNYYRDHWRRMRARSGGAEWFDLKLPVLAALAVTPEPIPVAMIDSLLGGAGRSRVAAVIEEWDQFLRKEVHDIEGGGTVTCYALYHGSFRKFLEAREQVAEVGLEEMRHRLGLYRGIDTDPEQESQVR